MIYTHFFLLQRLLMHLFCHKNNLSMFFCLENDLRVFFVAKTIYALRPESYCALEVAIWKVQTFWASGVRRVRTLAGGQSLGILQLWSIKILQSRFVECTLFFLENLRKSGWLNVLNHILRISYFSVHLYRPGHDLFP